MLRTDRVIDTAPHDSYHLCWICCKLLCQVPLDLSCNSLVVEQQISRGVWVKMLLNGSLNCISTCAADCLHYQYTRSRCYIWILLAHLSKRGKCQCAMHHSWNVPECVSNNDTMQHLNRVKAGIGAFQREQIRTPLMNYHKDDTRPTK